MRWIRELLARQYEDRELLEATSRNVIYTIGALYLLWHFTATLTWPQVFSPSLWGCTLLMLVTFLGALRLLSRSFALAQAVWFGGLTLAILYAFWAYQRVEVAFLLCLFPLISFVMSGLKGTLLVESLILALAIFWERLPFVPQLPPAYTVGMVFLSLVMAALGWSLSNNLLSAIESASYHYKIALDRLKEAREHRAQISVLLNEISKSNYQLDRLNKMLTFAWARAEEARAERDRFALAVSHELRSPLNFIIGFSDLMVNSPEAYAPLPGWPAGLYDDIQEIYRSSTHLHSLINDILDLGKMDARQMILFKQKAEIGEVVAEVKEMVAGVLVSKHLYLEVQIEPDLPVLYLDRTRIRQVLLNLVSNALHFTQEGGVTLRALRTSPEFVCVEVQDTGAGIAAEELEKVFEEFRQAGSQPWQREKGSGLGLSIGRRFVQLHGGEMGAHSVVGQGSTFYFTLPINEPPAQFELQARLAALHASSGQATQDQSNNLLFLSANLAWADLLGEALPDYRVTLIGEVEQLRLAVEQLYPRAVLVDQALYEHGTVQAFIQDPPYEMPIIALAVPLNPNRTATLPEGVSRYLIKPVARQDLVEAVHALEGPLRTLLVVDDDPAMLRFVAQTLRADEDTPEAGSYRIIAVERGDQALEILRSRAIDALLLDLDLPDMNGLQVLEQMRKDPACRSTPVIIISANDLPATLTPQGVSALQVWIKRPFLNQELIEILKTVLAKIATTYHPPAEI